MTACRVPPVEDGIEVPEAEAGYRGAGSQALPGMLDEAFCRKHQRRRPEIAILVASGMNHGSQLDDPSRPHAAAQALSYRRASRGPGITHAGLEARSLLRQGLPEMHVA